MIAIESHPSWTRTGRDAILLSPGRVRHVLAVLPMPGQEQVTARVGWVLELQDSTGFGAEVGELMLVVRRTRAGVLEAKMRVPDARGVGLRAIYGSKDVGALEENKSADCAYAFETTQDKYGIAVALTVVTRRSPNLLRFGHSGSLSGLAQLFVPEV